MSTSDSKSFEIITLVISLLLGFYALANILYYNRIKSNPAECVRLTTAEMNALYWSSWGAGALALILFIWSLIRMFGTK